MMLRSALATALFALAAAPLAAAEIRVLPQQFTLHGAEGRQRLSVVRLRDSAIGPQVEPARVELRSSAPEVVAIEGQRAIAVGHGRATITATTDQGETASAEVEVTGAGGEHHWSFRHEVESVLAKRGCNGGACHGALAGKGGFRLSLNGYDPESDFFTITRQARGRGVELADPGRSLVLAKPTGALPHKGGLKLPVDSRDYRVLSEWIAAGAAGPQDDDAQLTEISVLPESARLDPGDASQILVHAHYSDGRIVDVTHWAKFTATDEAVLGVDEQGTVSVRGSGQGAVLVWFGSKVALARMTAPYPREVPERVYADAPRRNFIDELNLAQLETLRLRPSPRCSDEAFLRRATLDCVGRLPTDEERAEYWGEDPQRRRDRLIERLLAHEDFVDYWAYRWSDVLLINGTRLRPAAVQAYYRWVHDSVRENKPWDQFVREIITATGISTENGATNSYALHQTPEDRTENASQAFLGLSIGCAKCHNHPLEKWTNDQYYAMANLFARVRAIGWGGESRNGDGVRTLYVSTSGELIQPGEGKPRPPAPLDAEPIPFDAAGDRREVLADWMTDPENPYFARAITNRIWGHFFGRGLVEPVDDLRLSNPASSEALLAAAADHLVDAGFDLKQLMRTILQSETYARSSVPQQQNRAESKYHSRYYPRRLMAEVLLDSVDQVLETSTPFHEIAFPGADKQKTDFYPAGTRAIELYDSAVSSYFLKTFGRNPRGITCECERSGEPSMIQVLHLSNGDTLNPKLSAEENWISGQIESGAEDEKIVRAMFQRALARQPDDQELQEMMAVIAEYGDQRRQAIEDPAWKSSRGNSRPSVRCGSRKARRICNSRSNRG